MPTIVSGESWDRIVIRPSDIPAAELPEAEPTHADLLAIELGDETVIDRRVTRSLQIAALEHTHRQLMELRRQMRITSPEPRTTHTTTLRRAA